MAAAVSIADLTRACVTEIAPAAVLVPAFGATARATREIG